MYEFLEYQVCDTMTYRPVTITRATPLSEVEALFEAHDFNCLPVSEEGALLGIVTKLDVLRAFAFGPRTLVPRYEEIMRQPAETVMTHQPVTVTPDMNLTRVLQMMAETRYRSFPVVIGALLVGIIAREDVLQALRRAAAGERPRSGPLRPAREEGGGQWTSEPSSVR
jgi:CBS domain-containing protein